jgi:hypothetical protein
VDSCQEGPEAQSNGQVKGSEAGGVRARRWGEMWTR